MIRRGPILPGVLLPGERPSVHLALMVLWEFVDEVTHEGAIANASVEALQKATDRSRSSVFSDLKRLRELGAIHPGKRATARGVQDVWIITSKGGFDAAEVGHPGRGSGVQDLGLSPGSRTQESRISDSTVRTGGLSPGSRTQSRISDSRVQERGFSPGSRIRAKPARTAFKPPKSRMEQTPNPKYELTPEDYGELNFDRNRRAPRKSDHDIAPVGAPHTKSSNSNSKPECVEDAIASDVSANKARKQPIIVKRQSSGDRIPSRKQQPAVTDQHIDAVCDAMDEALTSCGHEPIGRNGSHRGIIVKTTIREGATLDDWRLRIRNLCSRVRGGLDDASWLNFVHLASPTGWSMHRTPSTRRSATRPFVPSGKYDEAVQALAAASPHNKKAGAAATASGDAIDLPDEEKPF